MALRLTAVAAIALFATASANAQPGRGFGGGGFGTNKMSLLGIEDVRKDLKITGAQQKKLDELRQKSRERMRGFFGGGGGRPDWSKMREQMQKATKENEQAIAKILTSTQEKRLTELLVQAQGIRALLDKSVAKDLGISESKQKKISEALDFRKQMQEFQKYIEKKALSELSSSQKKKFESMKGKKAGYSLRPRFGGFGGGRGPGGRGPGGGGRPGGGGNRPERPDL